MSEINNITKIKQNQYKHHSFEQRERIQNLIEQKDVNGSRLFSNTYVANDIGVHKSTISR